MRKALCVLFACVFACGILSGCTKTEEKINETNHAFEELFYGVRLRDSLIEVKLKMKEFEEQKDPESDIGYLSYTDIKFLDSIDAKLIFRFDSVGAVKEAGYLIEDPYDWESIMSANLLYLKKVFEERFGKAIEYTTDIVAGYSWEAGEFCLALWKYVGLNKISVTYTKNDGSFTEFVNKDFLGANAKSIKSFDELFYGVTIGDSRHETELKMKDYAEQKDEFQTTNTLSYSNVKFLGLFDMETLVFRFDSNGLLDGANCMIANPYCEQGEVSAKYMYLANVFIKYFGGSTYYQEGLARGLCWKTDEAYLLFQNTFYREIGIFYEKNDGSLDDYIVE